MNSEGTGLKSDFTMESPESAGGSESADSDKPRPPQSKHHLAELVQEIREDMATRRAEDRALRQAHLQHLHLQTCQAAVEALLPPHLLPQPPLPPLPPDSTSAFQPPSSSRPPPASSGESDNR